MDANQINALLWTGAAVNTAADVEWIKGNGITADLDLEAEQDDSQLLAAADPAIRYRWNPTADDGTHKDVGWFKASWDFAESILSNGGVLLAHCGAGVNRGPSTAYFCLRAFWHMTGDDAFALLREKRPIVEVRYRPDADEALVALGLG